MHIVAVAVHPHVPAVHADPLPKQRMPHAPQLFASLVVSTHVPPQFI